MTSHQLGTTREKLDALYATLAHARALLVVMQEYPDPDALASAAGLLALAAGVGVGASTVTSGGVVGRAENRALMRYLALPFQPLSALTIDQFDCVALVDTQPGTGNNALGEGLVPDVVLDHHPLIAQTENARFFDVRRTYGATATIVYEYLQVGNVPIDTKLATALVYGIRSDTHDLGRDACPADIDAMTALYPRANHRMLSKIQASKTPRAYFAMLASALQHARVYGDCVVSDVGHIETPDIVGEIADLLLRDESCQWSLCFGEYEGQVLLSLRTSAHRAEAGSVMRRLVDGIGTGGGHRTMAGGQIRCQEGTSEATRRVLESRIETVLLDTLGITEKTPLPFLPA